MDFGIDTETRGLLERAREIGEQEVRPAGLEADRMGAPLPPDHAYFKRCIERGEGRTHWPGPGRRPAPRPPGATVLLLLLAEEYAYWDRGIGVANPGPGLPEGNVLAAGRCICVERSMADLVRLIPNCFVTGHAAGVAAAVAVEDKCRPRDVDVAKVQKVLRQQEFSTHVIYARIV